MSAFAKAAVRAFDARRRAAADFCAECRFPVDETAEKILRAMRRHALSGDATQRDAIATEIACMLHAHWLSLTTQIDDRPETLQ